MGTTSEKLTYLNTTKSNIKDSIELMGTTILSEDTFRSYADKIKNQLKLYLKENSVETLWNNWEKVEGEGETLTLNNTMEGKMKVDLKGNTQQNGTPTPDTPIPVQVVSGDNTINVSGDNLFDKDNANVLNAYIYTETGTIENGASHRTIWINIKPNTTYTISKIQSARFVVGTYVNQPANAVTCTNFLVNYNATQLTITSGANDKYLAVWLYNSSVDTLTYENIIATLQIEEGNQATPYQPYQSATYPISLGNIELCKIGTYQDKIYKDNGKWYLNKQIGKEKLTSSNVVYHGVSNNIYQYEFNSIYTPLQNQSLSTHFSYKSRTQWWAYDNQIVVETTSDNVIHFYITTSDYANITQFNNFTSSNDVYVYYVLATPTYEEITDTTLLSQLEALAYSYEGTTNISQVNDDLPSELDVVALEDI